MLVENLLRGERIKKVNPKDILSGKKVCKNIFEINGGKFFMKNINNNKEVNEVNFEKEFTNLCKKIEQNLVEDENSVLGNIQKLILTIRDCGVRENFGEMYDRAIINGMRRSLEKSQELDGLIQYCANERCYKIVEDTPENIKLAIKRANKIIREVKYLGSEYSSNSDIMSCIGMIDSKAFRIINSLTPRPVR